MDYLFGPKNILAKIKQLNANAKQPEYSRRQWYWKISHILVGAITFDVIGNKMLWYDIEVYSKHLTPGQVAGDPVYLFYLVTMAGLMALTFWRVLEVYWWAQARANSPMET